jgi:hypothetical protein
MFLFYVLAALPVLVGIYLWFNNAEVTWLEWLGSSALSFILAGCIHFYAIKSMTADTETWNGIVDTAVHIPQWVDYHAEIRTRTVGSGKNMRTETYVVWVHSTHPEKWYVETNIGSFSINSAKYNELVSKMGEQASKPGYRPDYDSGDRNDYFTQNVNNWQEPVNKYVSFENRIKAAPTVFSYGKVPEGSPVFDYPDDNDLFVSNRLLGHANAINKLKFDQMNGRLGPKKFVNVIVCGFIDGSVSLGTLQESKFIGGKKNDLVICYGIDSNKQKVSWAYVFGWTEKDLVKRNIESIMLNNVINDGILPLIEKEIEDNYILKDWSKFDYISIPIPGKYYAYFLIFMVITQVGYYIWAFNNDVDKPESSFKSYVKRKVSIFDRFNS